MKNYPFLKLMLLLSILLCWQQKAVADDVYTLGERATVDNFKNGDLIILRNATCDVGKLRNAWDHTDRFQPGKNQFLNGSSQVYSMALDAFKDYPQYRVPALDVMDPDGTFTSDYVFELDSVGIVGSVSNKPMFYLRNVATGKYYRTVFVSLYEHGVVLTNDIDSAAAFEFDNASKYSSWYTDSATYNAKQTGWDSSTSLADNNSVAIFQHIDNIKDVVGGKNVFLQPNWNMGYTMFRWDTDAQPCIMWNAYKASAKLDYKAMLTDLVKTLKDVVETYSVGTNPGQYADEPVQDLQDQFTDAKALLAAGSGKDSQYESVYRSLSAAYAAADASMVPVSDGYYNIVSADPDFMTSQSVEKAMSVSGNYAMTWQTLNQSDPLQLFKISKLSDGNYSVQNVGSSYYIGKTDAEISGKALNMTEKPEVDQVLTTIGKTGQWKLSNTTYSMAYTMSGYDNGAGVNGAISILEAGANSPSAWYLRPIPDQSAIDQLVKAGEQCSMIMALNGCISNANAAYSRAVDHDPLITSVSQLSTNSSSADDHSSLEHLIDGKLDYEHCFHSMWNLAMAERSTTEAIWQSVTTDLVNSNPDNIAVGTGYHNLQVKFNTPMQKFYLTFYGRTGTEVVDSPTDIEVYATNDDDLGASADQADIGDWDKITELTEGFPGAVQGGAYVSPVIDLGSTYKYVRFVIKASALMNQRTFRTFVVPDVTGVTWNVGELQLYSTEASTASSEYYKVPGMKEACDDMNKLVEELSAKLKDGTAQYSDTTDLNAAIHKVNSLYIDRSQLYSQLTNTIGEANSLYNTSLNHSVTLITNEGQLNTNSSSASDASSLEHLIDGDLTTIFGSRWSSDMKNADLTTDDWIASNENFVASNNKNIAVGVGYHDLQVKFINPVDSFYFEYTGRNSADYHDNPTDIEVYVTNDDNLGASPDMEDIDSWTKITELNSGFPTGALGKYTSPMINLNGSYRYARFVVKNASTAFYTEGGGRLARLFLHPEITGVTWDVSEFQAYTTKASSEMQYYYDSDYKAAVDNMKSLASQFAAVPEMLVFNDSMNTALRNAIDKVSSMAISSIEADNYFTMCEKMVNTSTVGTEIGNIDSQEAIDNFKAAITAAKSAYTASTPTTQSINTAISALRTAYEAFYAHVNKVEAGKWYNILSGATAEVYDKQPIYLTATSVGSALSFGGYPEDRYASTDPTAMWRFVPIEGTSDEYAIQSMLTGQYFGGYRGIGSANNPLLSHEKTPYKIIYYGNGNFKLRQASVDNVLNSLRANVVNNIVINSEAVDDDEQSWSFSPVKDNELELTLFNDNSLQIFTLPFATTGSSALDALNEGAVTTYAIMAVDTVANTLKLKKQSDFQAGEPMIIKLGDPSASTHDPVALTLTLPGNVVDHSDIISNGLVGTLEGGTIMVNGAGYLYNNMLRVAGRNGVVLRGLSGYIDLTKIKNQDGDADLTIGAKDFVTDIDKVVPVAVDYVDVYSPDGVLLKHHVKGSAATEGLTKGIYIVGGKKVLVK